MKLNSIEDVKALTEYQKIDQIQRIEKKIHRLSFVPASICAILISWAFWGMWFGQSTWSPMNIVLIAIALGSIGHSNVQRTDLLRQLFELKYGQ
ncbi:hypothetical protein OAP14_06870 [Aliiglaciecola sp.]|nr:hypothetical protein [Aliiglaciecola sp.]